MRLLKFYISRIVTLISIIDCLNKLELTNNFVSAFSYNGGTLKSAFIISPFEVLITGDAILLPLGVLGVLEGKANSPAHCFVPISAALAKVGASTC